MSRVSDDAGIATVLTAFMVAALTAVAMGGIWIGSAVVARHRAQSAADLAALAAAAQVVAGPAAACRRAVLLAEAAGVRLQRCDVEDLDVVVTVTAGTGRLLGGRSTATARAGPA